MRLNEITDSEDIVNLLKKNCHKWLNDIGNNMAFRGVYSDLPLMKVKLDSNRLPTSTPYYIHKYFIRGFKELGFIANRDNSFFVFGNRASTYGSNNYGFFPIGDYDFTWSPKVLDLYISMPYIKEIEQNFDKQEYYEYKFVNINPKDIPEDIKKSADKMFVIKTKPNKVVIFSNEKVTINPKIKAQLFQNVIPASASGFVMAYRKSDDANIDYIVDFLKEKEYQSTDIVGALQSHNEVMIHCEEAYMVRQDKIPYAELGFTDVPNHWFRN